MMSSETRVIAIDWSGSKSAPQKTIWIHPGQGLHSS